jgi:hypothetical protein
LYSLLEDGQTCPVCGSSGSRTVEERIRGWVGIQRFDDPVEYGIDLIRNGRAIRISEKAAFFEYIDDFKRIVKDYPIDSPYGRIIGEVHLNHCPVDFLKQDFQRTSLSGRGLSRFARRQFAPAQPARRRQQYNPVYRLYQGYRRVRSIGKGDMYMGYWDAAGGVPKRISRETEKEYYEKFLCASPVFMMMPSGGSSLKKQTVNLSKIWLNVLNAEGRILQVSMFASFAVPLLRARNV